ncbi:alpha-L-fucosidase [Sphingobacteriaceae bacterium WQ 2009]|uniref:alpha-L-fucosidase n=1 Tax=Rhinopithecimicrobium faecis TaxID=2820698 RepID=A0A8T4HBZ7_9SPHI|nr:alpha-L-fucosidase [Sphingobacteriaceae bacterium WQ 2009]
MNNTSEYTLFLSLLLASLTSTSSFAQQHLTGTNDAIEITVNPPVQRLQDPAIDNYYAYRLGQLIDWPQKPQDFNAKLWAQRAQSIGVKYVIIPTQQISPQLLQEAVEAYSAAGVAVFLTHPLVNVAPIDEAAATMDEAAVTMDEASLAIDEAAINMQKDYFRSLVTNFPKIKGLWLDKSWDKSWAMQPTATAALESELRSLRPALMLVQGNIKEQLITTPNTKEDILDLLMNAVSTNENTILRIAPDAQGSLRKDDELLINQLSTWMKVNGETIFGTQYADFPPAKNGYFTRRGDILYYTVFHLPIAQSLRMAIPKSTAKIPTQAYLLANGKTVQVKAAPSARETADLSYLEFVLPSEFKPQEAFVLKIRLDKRK